MSQKKDMYDKKRSYFLTIVSLRRIEKAQDWSVQFALTNTIDGNFSREFRRRLKMFRCLNTGALSLSVHVEEALGLASRHGFAGLDLPIGELFRLAEASSVQEVKDLFHSTGLR